MRLTLREANCHLCYFVNGLTVSILRMNFPLLLRNRYFCTPA